MRVEATHVECRQLIAVVKQATHVGHIACIEVAHVKGGERLTFFEHGFHADHLAGVQKFHAIDVGEQMHLAEPVIGADGAGVGIGGIEHRTGNLRVVAIVEPSGLLVGGQVGGVGLIRAARGALAVVVERQRLAVG